MDSLFDTIVSKHVDGVTSRSISSHIPSKFHVLLACLAFFNHNHRKMFLAFFATSSYFQDRNAENLPIPSYI